MPSRPPTFEQLLEAVPDATLGVDASGCVAFANARARELLGRPLVGEPLGELPAPLHATRRPLGEYTLVTLRDIDPRTLQAALDNTPAAIFVKDPEGRYLLVNRA